MFAYILCHLHASRAPISDYRVAYPSASTAPWMESASTLNIVLLRDAITLKVGGPASAGLAISQQVSAREVTGSDTPDVSASLKLKKRAEDANKAVDLRDPIDSLPLVDDAPMAPIFGRA